MKIVNSSPDEPVAASRLVSVPAVGGTSGRPVVEAVIRALRLLDCFEHGRPEMTLTEFVRRSGFSKTTTYRLLVTLEHAGWLERTPAGAFRLTIRAFQLGTVLVDSLELRREAGPVMAELAASYGDTVYLVVPSGAAAVCLERIDSGQAIRIMDLDVGGSQPLHLGAGPRALLAFRESEFLPLVVASGLRASTPASIVDLEALRVDLQQSRERGYTVSRGDMTSGIGAVGAPVFDRSGLTVAAISIGGQLERFERERMEDVARGLVDACGRLSVRLGYRSSALAPTS